MAAIASVTSYEYAAGTCTLRLVGELSPLSRVTDRPVLSRSRFHLQMHQQEATEAAQGVANPTVLFELSGREPQFSTLSGLVQGYVQRRLSADALTAREIVSQGASSLQSVGLTRHRLTLAAPPNPPSRIELSTLQLSDLADALEQAEGNLQIIPDHTLAKARRTRPRLPLWLGSVAAVGIAALLGNQFLTTAPGPVVLSPSESQTATDAIPQAPAGNRPLSTEELSPAGDANTAPEATEKLPPADTSNGPPPPAPRSLGNSASPSEQASNPEASPLPSGPAPRPPQASPAPTTRASPSPELSDNALPQADAGAAAQLARPDSDQAAEPDREPVSPSAIESVPRSPNTFDTGAYDTGARSAAPSAQALDPVWVDALTNSLQQQWRPPANLAATLYYRLTLKPDGTVESLDPLNDLSATYQVNPTLPQPGTTLPGVGSSDATTVEVEFKPSGEVVVTPAGQPIP